MTGSARRRWLPVAAVAIAGATVFGACGGDDTDSFGVADAEAGDAAADYEFLIPAGTGERMDAGEPVDIIPGELDVAVGETIEIVNEDDRGHLVGPFFVGAGETLRQRFSSPGEFIGACSVHPSGELIVTVSP